MAELAGKEAVIWVEKLEKQLICMTSAYISLRFIINKQIKYHCFVNITVSLVLGRVFFFVFVVYINSAALYQFFLGSCIEIGSNFLFRNMYS